MQVSSCDLIAVESIIIEAKKKSKLLLTWFTSCSSCTCAEEPNKSLSAVNSFPPSIFAQQACLIFEASKRFDRNSDLFEIVIRIEI